MVKTVKTLEFNLLHKHQQKLAKEGMANDQKVLYTKAVFSKNRKGVCMHVSFLVNFSRSSQYEAYLQHTWLLSNLYHNAL